ncbi:hypothetical protein Dsin_006277 [Dipteronia sinensis]|uniref:Reverse transcriptase zinc-binding domain-containing protein n=1 Tax=Dipteronia sinensis TaxID=43782 RepID=A0AAE0AYW3_9ROSI|nr:hypothetical protein Dsin_006277 [Dipteronia sinensis]
MKCLTSASYSFLINGESRGKVMSSKGLRQGCPLSPYLFLLCAEDLSAMITQVEMEGGRTANRTKPYPRLNNMAKVRGENDTFPLRKYELASGQSINFKKSAITFSPNTSADNIIYIKTLFDIEVVACSPRWLPDRISVSDLIDSPGKWNEPLIKRYFLPQEAELILSIPLSVHQKRDSVLWHFDRKGSFTVKSAYRVAISAIRSYEASCSSGPHPWWKKLWSLPLPNKIKIFCWRVCRNILPTKDLLYRRGIIDSALCMFCAKARKQWTIHYGGAKM